MAENTREIVLDMLLELERGEAYSHKLMSAVLDKYNYLGMQDKAFMKRLAEGTTERRVTLDYVLDQFSGVPVRKMKPLIRVLMRMSVYQLLYMDSIPDSAVCNEAVKLAEKRKFRNLKGFVNGVLRSIARDKEKAMLPFGKEAPKKPDAAYLSVRYSMPLWIVERWLKAYGADTAKVMLESYLKERPTQIRCNTAKIAPEELKKRLEAEGVTVRDSVYLPYAFEISGYDYLEKITAFEEGLFQVQDISSMLVAACAAPEKDAFCLDVCAAPGGKSMHLSDLLGDSGMVEARDLTEYKIGLIEDNIYRSGKANVRAKQWDATVFDPAMEEKADVVIADLPCSGLGVIGRKKDIKYRMEEGSLEELAKLQREILTVVHRYVKQGGILVYSTCTVNPAENEENVRWFLEQFDFEPVSLDDTLCEELHGETTAQGYLQLLPGIHKSDGFFISKFRRR